MKTRRHICGVIVLSCLVFIPVLALAGTKLVDEFEYKTVDQLKTVWTIQGEGFTGPLKVRLNTEEAKEGKQCLEVLLPPTKTEGLARLILDVFPKVVPKGVKQIRFWLYVERTKGIGQSGLYWCDKDLKNCFVRFSALRSQDGWQRVWASQSGFTLKEGNPSWDNVNVMRISLWFNANDPANRILLDEVVWDSEEERPMNLNKNRYDSP